MAQTSKYGNRKVVIDNVTFDSAAEAARYQQLCLMVKAGAITDLVLQPRYELQRAFADNAGKRERAIVYVADFSYTENGKRVVEDVKGHATKEYLIKAKLFKYKYFDLDYRVLNT